MSAAGSGAPEAGRAARERAQALEAHAVESLPAGALAQRIAAAEAAGRPLRVKLGIDPTAPDIHLGHAVVLRKLREFQDAGHTVVLIVGDFTARVGDPSGRSELRPMLDAEQIAANARTFREQALHILSDAPARLEVRHNSEWLTMGLADALALLKTTTVAQLTEREDFAARLAAGQPVSVLELLYPLLQGYDSVAVGADVEVGGTDQKFNLLLGRDIQRAYGREEQAILTLPILVGTDGHRKMSKSLGNHIGITEPPEEIYGKTMSIPDEAMDEYYELLLGRPRAAGQSPREAKRELARELVAWLHSPAAAARAQAHFDRVVVAGEQPEQVADFTVAGELRSEPVHLPAVIAAAFDLSRSEARRLLAEGAVRLDGERLGEGDQELPGARLDGEVLQVGKRRFARLRLG